MIETGNFQGDPKVPSSLVWQSLDEFIYRRLWRYSNGDYLRTRLMFVDSGGHCTDDVYKYCKVRHPRVFAIKGIDSEDQSIIIGGGVKRRQKVVEGVWLVRVGSNYLKDELQSRIAITNPGPGYCHWPMAINGMPSCGYTLEYFQEIMSNQRELTYDKSGFAKYKWTKNRTDQDEALSCQVYGRAALEYLRVKLEQMERDTIKLEQSDIEKVEIGLGRTILTAKARSKTRKPINQYGGTTTIDIEGGDVSTSATRTKTRNDYGAGSDTSF